VRVFKKGYKSVLGKLIHDTSMPEKMAAIPFDEIAAGASARLCVIENMQYLSLRDTLMHICDLNKKRANEKRDRLPENVKKEVAAFCGDFLFLARLTNQSLLSRSEVHSSLS
jgi:hypothetical protein